MADYSYGKNVTPSEVKVGTRDDGKESIVYGNNRSENGKIGNPHGHTVRNKDGSIDYARSKDDSVIKNGK
jgi:hypothetical protein